LGAPPQRNRVYGVEISTPGVIPKTPESSKWLKDHTQALGRPIAPTMPVMLDNIGTGVERYMNLLSARQKLVASNIANADTPGYKTKDIDFRGEFESQMANVSPTAVEVSGLKTKNDGNNVDMDREARLLAENALRFSVASNLAHSEIQTLKDAIDAGKSA
jgi:flagellar basal-body rod protein FlgB